MVERSKWLALIALCLVFQIFMVIYIGKTGVFTFFSTNSTHIFSTNSTHIFSTNSTHIYGIPDTCSLANYSSWDSRMMKYSDVYWDRKEYVCEKPEEWGYLEQQVLKSRPGYQCKGRCMKYGEWQENGTKFDCEYIETECWTTKSPVDTRGSILLQIVEKPISPPVPSPKRHNIYVLMVDSVSVHQSRRNFPKTLYFLHQELQAVEYSYVNKLGLNSYPNAIPLWYGRTVIDIDKQLMGINTTKADWEAICNDLNKTAHIFTDAEKLGYKTLLSEYWFTGIFNDGGLPCTKATRQFRPDHESPALFDDTLRSRLRPANDCQKIRKTLAEGLSYFSQFTKSYKDVPKFGWLWLAINSHEYEKESMLEDTELYDFFIRNKEELSNSFVFFMADHGLRFGPQVDIELGEYGSRNPFLAISVPKELRGGRLMENLRKNSGQLQTHYDTRATWLDIMNYQPAVNYAAWKMEQFGEEKGNSYLREQPGPRTCHTLPIPFQFCICQYKMEKIDSNSKMGKKLANSVLDLINGIIIDSNHTSKCGLWELKEAEMEGYHPIKETKTFQAFLKVRQNGRENAGFRTTVRYNSQGQLELIFAGRVDRRRSTGDCAIKDVREYCYCI